MSWGLLHHNGKAFPGKKVVNPSKSQKNLKVEDEEHHPTSVISLASETMEQCTLSPKSHHYAYMG
ncbi:hypothetical protein MtrunA17_Chr2g0331921 [Medicago truncatula]|uniref:Uncharacterized protein n=1 Tax=Medicago truncatula TaxID=3880 RepID=A0A396JDZ4_MEDTR|nr:hypothetical protein MtrunA17_Chr2g0331921 [Medicago truncatula]